MRIIHVFESIPDLVGPSVVLLGPSTMDRELTSWRQDAIELFQSRGYTGTLLIPESKTRHGPVNYKDHLQWVLEACEKAGVLLFWIPRHMETLPALKQMWRLECLFILQN